jgi:hypothetical protein
MSDELRQVEDKNTPGTRKSVNLLPILFRTDKNSKFLAGTIDQLIQPPQLNRLDGWVGSRITPTYNPSKDFYIESNLKTRQDYQLEPALVVTNDILKIIKSTSYDDLINQLDFEGANTKRLDRLFDPKFYSYDPHIDWDKFVNFEKYYWMPAGPNSISISNQQREIVSTYNVTDTADGFNFVFTPDGLTPAPQLTLYRGVTYKFNVKSTSKFWIKTSRITGKEAPFRASENNGISEGVITLKLDHTSPKSLYYISETEILNGGEFIIKDIEENSFIDVDKEILGKKHYTTHSGIELTNGMKINFVGEVSPAEYRGKDFIVEGVGRAIKLVEFDSLVAPERFSTVFDERFDSYSFDQYAFDQSINLPQVPEYVTINKSSQDKNPWSRYNRWFHEDVIRLSAEINKVPVLLPFEHRAKRPIIEFEADMQLHNFGSFVKKNVQFIDTITTDVFSSVEGSVGFYIDGEEIGQGDRVIFTADNDSFVNNKTYIVNFVKIGEKFRISLDEETDVTPQIGDSVVITKGNIKRGENWWFNGQSWVSAQQKIALNQAPRFEIFDNTSIAYSSEKYKEIFLGSKIFGYSIGSGNIDPVLGFPLKYKNISNQAYYLFENYFMSDVNFVVDGNESYSVPVANGFIKRNVSRNESTYVNVWTEAAEYQIPILQYSVIQSLTTELEITSVENAGYQSMNIDVFVNDDKKTLNNEYTVFASGRRYFVVFTTPLVTNDKVLLKIKTSGTPSATGYYEPSLGFTNNPLNGPIGQFTLTELSDHVKTMVDRHPDFAGAYPGTSNIRDIDQLSSYGTRLISNKNPLSFAAYFIANDKYNLLAATRTVAQHYSQFKLGLINQITNFKGNYTAANALDIALYNMNVNKEVSFPYTLSDMVPYGTDVVSRAYPVTDSRNKRYSLTSVFNLTELSLRAVIVYRTDVNGTVNQLLHGSEYEFDLVDSSVNIKIDLVKGDTITVSDYFSTEGCYVPPTPSKLGLYPKFEPKIYVDDTYAGDPQTVIQGHDGSIMIAFGDYRDEIILEFEKRVFNNIKVTYNPDLVDVNSVLPGAFRSNKYSLKEANDILSREFLKWDSFYGFNYSKNSTASDARKTWNFKSGKDLVTKLPLPGNWRGIYKYFFDTDRPHTHPWEMLGFTIMPEWWVDAYGPAPYTRGNTILWEDIEAGYIRIPNNAYINPQYTRTGLSRILPVDDNGNLLDPAAANIATGLDYLKTTDNWKFGDIGPVEAAWRRSSLFPFAAQILMALAEPAKYSSLMFDTSRVSKNLAGQYGYGINKEFMSFDILELYQDIVNNTTTLATGYSVFLIEAGKQKNRKYLSELKAELKFLSFRLAYKLGGFINKDKFKVIVDSVSPNSTNAGVALGNEDHEIFLDTSSPIRSLGVSGIIVERTGKGYSIRGYDTKYPYFTCLLPEFSAVDPSITIGGRSESYVEWAPSAANPMTGLDTTSVSTNSGYRYYKQGQVVAYLGKYYRVKIGHNSGPSFDSTKFQPLPALPIIGGVSVRRPSKFSTTPIEIPYGIEYENVEDIHAVILGYGKWLESQGCVFDEYNKELTEVLDWTFSSKEMLYWTTQKWSVGSVITLSPFANSLKFTDSKAVIDSVTNIFYDYSILTANGTSLSSKSISTNRDENVFVIKTVNTTDGIFFARLNLIQKEHTLVLNNSSMFNDVIYDTETGYRQRRIKLLGFITGGWNGDMFSPGFIYDEAQISNWEKFTDYSTGDVVFYAGNYYSAISKVLGATEFNFNEWTVLGSKPVAELLPNFDYKIGQFEDFYSLDIDNFDATQQRLAQHLVGYTPRTYLDNIFTNATSQYKFYQGYIKEKGTKNTISKLAKASIASQGGFVEYYEDWAFRVGHYGAYSTSEILEVRLNELNFKENPQIIELVNTVPEVANDFISYETPENVVIKPNNYTSTPFNTTSTLFSDSVSILPTAGYARLDDVTATAYNQDSLLDIANNRGLKDGDTVWVGFLPNGDWDIYRYTQVSTRIVDVNVYVPGASLAITTDYFHKLKVGDIISISQFDSQIDGVYTVDQLLELNQFVVSSVLSSLSIPFNPGVGLLFKFETSRFKEFDDLGSSYSIDKFGVDEKIWIDNSTTGRWAVYQKTNNFNSFEFKSPYVAYPLVSNQQYGFSIAGNDDGSKFIVSSPNFFYNSGLSNAYGKIYVYKNLGLEKEQIVPVGSINPNPSVEADFFTGSESSSFGHAIKFDNDNNFAIIGAPTASFVRQTTYTDKFSTVNLVASPLTYANQGFVKFSKIDFDNNDVTFEFAIGSPEPAENANFGHDIFVGNISTSSKVVFVASPGQNNNQGAVYHSIINVVNTNSVQIVTSVDSNVKLPMPAITDSSRFGHAITGNYDGTRVAVAAPGWSTSTGAVYVYTSSDHDEYVTSQIITSVDPFINNVAGVGVEFGQSIAMDRSGEYLFISATKASDRVTRSGKVLVMKLSNGQYVLDQVIDNPYVNNGYDFGSSIVVSSDNKTVIISSTGSSHKPFASFDTYSQQSKSKEKYILDDSSSKRLSNTTFDSNTTKFYSVIKNSGAVFTFVKEQNKYVFGEELFNQLSTPGQLYGNSTFVHNKGVIIGAPGLAQQTSQNGALYFYNSLSDSLNSWKIIRNEENLVDLTTVKSIKTINTFLESVVDYMEIIDPLKGKISGFADQEISYKSLFDPAIYSIGVSGVAANTNANWLDAHVGELWWDLSSVKYVWYEQGELEFRRNSWNTLFPGSMIDVYEWVRSSFLPSQWSAIADTNEGLAQGISGQPKFVDNSVVSIKQVWNPISNSFSNVYYYWVKNKITIPENTTRRISAYDVASLIADPKSKGVKFASVIANNAVMLTNVESGIIGNQINLSIDLDSSSKEINKHTEWLLLQDGNESSLPSTLLVRKLIDSLLGRDNIGNVVPDPMLSERLKYGVGFRPRQSMFKDRVGALRTFVEYTNSVLKNYNIIDSVNLTKLISKDAIPNAILGTYDSIVEDLIERDFSVVTRNLKIAELSCEIKNGRISTVRILNPGFGYGTLQPSITINGNPTTFVGPTVTIDGTGSDAKIETKVNIVGEIVGVTIVNPGKNYTTVPTLIVRPFTVIVRADDTVNGRWSRYEWLYDSKTFLRKYTQSYDTANFWKYIDWVDPTYNSSQDIIATIDAPYQLPVVFSVPTGSYVKIRNGGDGRYIIVRKRDAAAGVGTYNDQYDLIYQENGTIELEESIWNYKASVYGWDQVSGWDQTAWDQNPAKETENIIYGLFEDILVGPLKIFYNKLFFKLVKYALTEQKSLDWAFKTSFINVFNRAGELDQRPVYKLNNESYYQDYINETKPYHTKIRNFTNNYTATDVTRAVMTDFDLPSVYSQSRGRFIPVTFGSPQLNTYPWKSWLQNYTYSVDAVEVYDGGQGYDLPPQVEITPQPGDTTGTGAKAEAYIALGKVSQIIVTDPGSGYTATPIINLIGGGPTNLTPARVSVRISNNSTRANTITMKFDRVTGYNEVSTATAYDSYIATGASREFDLTWAPNPDKNNITVKVNGIRVLSGDYTIEKYTEKFNAYTKQYGKLVLDSIPVRLSSVTIEYKKDHSLYHAVDRIRDYYSPISGMPGNTATLLMHGLEYPGVTIDTLPFEVSKGWDSTPFGDSNWDDFVPEVGSYETKGPRITAVVSANTTNNAGTILYFNIPSNQDIVDLKVNSTVTIATVVYTVTSSTAIPLNIENQTESRWKITLNNPVAVATGTSLAFVNPNPLVYSLPFVPASGEIYNAYVKTSGSNKFIRIDTSSTEFVGNGFVSTISVAQVYNANDRVLFRLESSDGSSPVVDLDLDTYINPNGANKPGWYYDSINGRMELTKSNDLEDINIDGDRLISATNSYGPEENLPGRVSDSLGINVYTYPKSGAALMINKKYIKDPVTNRYSIGFAPPSNESVEVLLNNRLLSYGVDYTIDYLTNEIVFLDDPFAAVRGPYFNITDALPRKQGTVIASNVGDDTFTGPYPLGFSWNMFGTLYTDVYVGTNGYLTFGNGDSDWTPLVLGILNNPAIYIEYCDLWQDFGISTITGNRTIPLDTGETPGLFLSNGEIGNFVYWRLRFQGTHYNQRSSATTVPAYQYEVTLYSDGTNQYIEMIYENTWRGVNFNGDQGFITGVALGQSGGVPGAGILVDDALIQNNTSHVFYSTSNGGDWKYAGQGSFDAFKNQNPDPELLSITTMSVGGKNLLEKASVPITYTSGQKVFEFTTNYSDIKSSYVTVNGIKITQYTLSGTQKNGTSGRVKLTLVNNLNIGDVLQVWFFASNDKAFSEIKEQLIAASSGTSVFTLTSPPGNIEPFHSQLIIERDGTRLSPPDTVYYSAANGVRSFSLDQHIDYVQGLPDRSRLEVYVNGIRTPFSETLQLNQYNNLVEFTQDALTNDDVVAITILRDHDYYVTGNKLTLTNRVDISTSSTIKVTTFNNHDNSMFRRERFRGKSSGIFKLSRTVLNSNYVWVEVNGKPVTRETEFKIKPDNRTIVLNKSYKLKSTDTVVIMSVVNQTSETLVGYRMFQDNLGRTHYKRISQENTTQLAVDLLPTDTSITVEDSSVLTLPNQEKHRPGVILVDGERIEFYKVEGNKLSWLRRGTLGTGVKSIHKESSIVLDQGPDQNIPLVETKNVDKFVINTTTNVNFTLTNVVINNDVTNAYNHIEVVYQGRVLRKPISDTFTSMFRNGVKVVKNTTATYSVTDVSVAYDSGEVNSAGTSSTVILNPEFSINTVTNVVTINFQPQVGSEVKVIQLVSQEVGFEYSNLHSRNVDQIKFLLERPSFLPDKYYYGQNTTTDQYLVLESGDTLDSETGDPLIGS